MKDRTIIHKMFSYLLAKGFFDYLHDEAYIKLLYWSRMGKRLNLKNPQTFNEKLQWLKLYDRNPKYTTMVDKYAAKKWIADRIGNEYIIPTIGVWNHFDDIDFDRFPNQFVLKCTHDSGGLFIVRDKSEFDKNHAREKIEMCLKRNYYRSGREWPYKNVPPRIIAEEYVTNIQTSGLSNNMRLTDENNISANSMLEYKIFCFDGIAKMVLVCMGQAHGSGRTNDYCDLSLNRYPFKALNPNSKEKLERPIQLDHMIEIAEVLAKDIPQVRVDMYLCNGRILVGELTLYHNSGCVPIEPAEWDLRLGSWIELPKRRL